MQEIEPRLLTIKEACAEVKVSRRTMYNWLKAGKLDVIRTAGGALRINAASLWKKERPT